MTEHRSPSAQQTSHDDLSQEQDIMQPWLKNYPTDVPHELGEFEFENLGEYLEDIFTRYAALPAFTNFGVTLTFADIKQRSQVFAAYMTQVLGYKKGDRFAIMMPNLLQFPIVYYACLQAGIEVVNINPLYTARELEHQLHDSEVKGIIIAENFAHTLADVREQLPKLKHIIISRIGDELGALKGMLANIIVRYVKKLVPNYYFESTIDYKHIIREGGKLTFVPADVAYDDVAMLQYTGGTTGVAKGAMLTHRNLLANAKQIDFWIGSRVTEKSVILITALPLYHVFCCTVNTLCFPSRAMHTILITNPRDMKSFVKTLKKYPFTVMTVVNTLLKGLLHAPGFKELDFSSLKFVVAGGMPLEKIVAEQWKAVTGNVVIEGYGLTETSPIVTVNLLDNSDYTAGIGYPLPGTYVSIRDEDGEPVACNTAGEMWVKGPQVMKGYWKQEKESKNVLSEDGWLKTGDMAIMDERGFLRIVDRKKEMILVSGFNVYPSEIENVILEFEDILEVACVGIPDAKTGERVKAFIVLKENRQKNEQTLRAYLRENLTAYKRPKEIEYIDELPKSSVGKILRKELVKREKLKNKYK